MKKIKRISIILLCSLFGLTGCGSLSLIESFALADISMAVGGIIVEKVEDHNYAIAIENDINERKTD